MFGSLDCACTDGRSGCTAKGTAVRGAASCGMRRSRRYRSPLRDAIARRSFELTPDGKYLIATQFINQGRKGAAGAGMALFDIANKTFSKMAVADEPDKSWGDSELPVRSAMRWSARRISRQTPQRSVGVYVVNHGGRQSIEMFEVKPAAGSWALVWHGCEVAAHDYNDVAILPDGGFVGTYPTALSSGGAGGPFGGAVTGYVARWNPGKGEREIMGTRMRYPNGVVVSANGRFMYVNEFSGRQVFKYDLRNEKVMGSVKVDFLPDNLTWTKEGSCWRPE